MRISDWSSDVCSSDLHDLHRGARGGVVVAAVMVGGDQRNGHRGQVEEAAFHRRGHGAGIDDVVTEVGGVVDAGHDDVRLVLEHAGDGDVDAVGGRAVHAPHGGFLLDYPHRRVQGQRVAGT